MSATKERYHDEIEAGLRQKACKISNWNCPYHACMSDDCQKEEILKNHPGFGKGECEKTTMNDAEIQIREICSECRGSGMIVLPVWQLFHLCDQRYQEMHSGEQMPPELVKNWFKEHDYEIIPPEKLTCLNCSWKGKIYKWIPISSLPH